MDVSRYGLVPSFSRYCSRCSGVMSTIFASLTCKLNWLRSEWYARSVRSERFRSACPCCKKLAIACCTFIVFTLSSSLNFIGGLIEVYVTAGLCQELFVRNICCKSMPQLPSSDARTEALRPADRAWGLGKCAQV